MLRMLTGKESVDTWDYFVGQETTRATRVCSNTVNWHNLGEDFLYTAKQKKTRNVPHSGPPCTCGPLALERPFLLGLLLWAGPDQILQLLGPMAVPGGGWAVAVSYHHPQPGPPCWGSRTELMIREAPHCPAAQGFLSPSSPGPHCGAASSHIPCTVQTHHISKPFMKLTASWIQARSTLGRFVIDYIPPPAPFS